MTKFIEENSMFKGKREEIKLLNEQIRKLPDLGIVKVTETIEKAELNASGDAVKTQQLKEKKTYVDSGAEELYVQLKQKRR